MGTKTGKKSKANAPDKARNFSVIIQTDVPHTRHGKHRDIVTQILDDLGTLKEGNAMKVPLAKLKESKEKVRAALGRAVKQRGRRVVTSSDDTYLYIWNADKAK